MRAKTNVIAIVGIWLTLTVFAWFGPTKEISLAERRPLDQFPDVGVSEVLDGGFMEDFEGFALDQFPLRDSFRTLKSLFHYYVLNQSDNNGIYLAEGMALQQEYPLNEASVVHAADRFENLYHKYLQESNVYFAVVPDKGHYLAQDSGHLTVDMEQLVIMLREQLPWAIHVDISGQLTAQDYYRTDTHWRQERLLNAAKVLCEAMGVQSPKEEDYRLTPLERPFYGVYYGQAALPMKPETMYLLESDLLDSCMVYDYETGKTGPVYDLTKLESRDLYDVFLSGSKSLLTIENPNAEAQRELIVFRDSFGSAIVPLLVQGYSKVTLVDIRYIQSSMLPQYIDFHGQDVLFLYSTLVLNNSTTLR